MTRATGRAIMTTASFILSLCIPGQRPAKYLVKKQLEARKNSLWDVSYSPCNQHCHFLWMSSCLFPKQNFSLSREQSTLSCAHCQKWVWFLLTFQTTPTT